MWIWFEYQGHGSPDNKNDTHTEQQIQFFYGRKLEIKSQQESKNDAELANDQVKQVNDPSGRITLIHFMDESAYTLQ